MEFCEKYSLSLSYECFVKKETVEITVRLEDRELNVIVFGAMPGVVLKAELHEATRHPALVTPPDPASCLTLTSD